MTTDTAVLPTVSTTSSAHRHGWWRQLGLDRLLAGRRVMATLTYLRS
jgi:hypothetical protein